MLRNSVSARDTGWGCYTRYFPFSDILSAKVGSYPSFTWISICSARELIGEAILWRVGNGDRINIWNDPWLPGRGKNKIFVQEIRPTWKTVNQLIETEANTWNGEMVHNLVDKTTAARILSSPISGSSSEDMIVWKHEGFGEYIVKSGYRVLTTAYLQNTTHTSSNDNDYKEFYQALWSLNIPEKIKIHSWRLVNNLVPHFGNLARKTLCVEVICSLCKADLEDSDHLMLSCGTLQCVWASLQVKIPSFEALLCYKNHFVRTFSAADEQQKRIIVISIWGLWFQYEQDLSQNQENLRHSLRSMVKDLWRPRDYGVIKINFDATFQKEERLATTAILARDSTGEIVGAETYLFEDVVDAFVAEARACERALIFARMMGFLRLIVEGDSLTVIKSIKKKGEDKLVLRPITHHICKMGLHFDEVSYLFMPRTVNGAAHTLVLEGRRRKVCGGWVNGVPESVMMVAMNDRLAWNQCL
ncbi:hypothetical protein Golax_022779 [Gossypium laxum]|uniref:Reverse transcriptase n=1 Tax=Gossypium laxum TaxID=34288 RepID=A0A7J9B6Y7_9ROSI|nr:hypothetical protein [Gossypium laxum]